MSSTTSTQPQEKRVKVQPEPKAADAVEVKKAAMVDAVKAKGSITPPKAAPVRKSGKARSPVAQEVAKKLEAGVKPVPQQKVNPLAQVDALLAAQPKKVASADSVPAEGEAASFAKLPLEEQRKRAESYLPKSDKRLTVEFSHMQAEACLQALQNFTDNAPDYGNKRKNMVHDATVFTAYYVIEDALAALDATETIIEVVTADDIPEPVKEAVAAE